MPIKKPYFNLHQIISGQYTAGGEFVTEDGLDFVGQFHALPTGQFFTGPRPAPESTEIFVKRGDVTYDALVFNKIQNRKTAQYEVPISFNPRPTLEDYQAGDMERFFVQKRTSPLNTIIEIDSVQFNKINTNNNPGINGTVWNKIKIRWKISKLPIQDIEFFNTQTITQNATKFPGLGRFLNNRTEFYK